MASCCRRVTRARNPVGPQVSSGWTRQEERGRGARGAAVELAKRGRVGALTLAWWANSRRREAIGRSSRASRAELARHPGGGDRTSGRLPAVEGRRGVGPIAALAGGVLAPALLHAALVDADLSPSSSCRHCTAGTTLHGNAWPRPILRHRPRASDGLRPAGSGGMPSRRPLHVLNARDAIGEPGIGKRCSGLGTSPARPTGRGRPNTPFRSRPTTP